MVFVDGENLAIEGEKYLAREVPGIQKCPYYEPGTFLWFPAPDQARRLEWFGFNSHLFPPAIRSFFFTTYRGNDNVYLQKIVANLRALDFDAHVFPRIQGKSKIVDQSLTVTALHHAFDDHFDSALVVAGDADYIPLLRELKGMGKRVHLAFLGDVTPDHLRNESDRFIDIAVPLKESWQKYVLNGKTSIVSHTWE